MESDEIKQLRDSLEISLEENKKLLQEKIQLIEALEMAKNALEDNNIDESMAGEFEIITDALEL